MENDKSELDVWLQYFKIYQKLPDILMWCTFWEFFIIGVADGCYGFLFNNAIGLWPWIVWTLIGVFVSVPARFLNKTILSRKVLKMYYLQKCAGEKEKLVIQEGILQEEKDISRPEER